MPFALLVLATALFIEGIGTYISILGLSALFAGSIVVVTMAAALDVGKVVVVSFVYKNWSKINWLMKTYMTIATVVLMIITSAGVFGYLSGEFQKAIAGNNQQNVIITALQDEQARLQARKQEIDAQIANLPANFVNSRVRLANQFKDETKRINDRLAAIDVELPKLRVDVIGQNVKIGPIIYISEAFKVTPEQAVKWVIFVIIFVFDPLAVALLIAGNFLLEQRKSKAVPPAPLVPPPPPPRPVDDDLTVVRASEAHAPPPSPPPVQAVEEPPKEEIPVPQAVTKETQDIITLKQIKSPAPKPPPRSALEDVDAMQGDVMLAGQHDGSHHLKGLDAVYRIDEPVSVGGPSDRKR